MDSFVVEFLTFWIAGGWMGKVVGNPQARGVVVRRGILESVCAILFYFGNVERLLFSHP